jgi:2-polyprenyl-3-methyl-5-hydroxy-6-metoxy-1,4-benzoquinol methylase
MSPGGAGASTILMAQAFPACRFYGFDFRAPCIDTAREGAAEAEVADRVTFEVVNAKGYPSRNYDLVCCFDCLHDMGDPAGAARHAHETLAPRLRHVFSEAGFTRFEQAAETPFDLILEAGK